MSNPEADCMDVSDRIWVGIRDNGQILIQEDCGADFRFIHLSPEELQKIVEFCEKKRQEKFTKPESA